MGQPGAIRACDTRARTHRGYLCQSWVPSSRAALTDGGCIPPRCRVRCRRGDPNFQSERRHARLARPANRCPLYPQKRTSVERLRMSALCQKQTHAVQQKGRYSITSSARASSVGGIVNPSALAVLRLMTNSNLVGCWTGRSAGFTPFKILSTNEAAPMKTSVSFGP